MCLMRQGMDMQGIFPWLVKEALGLLECSTYGSYHRGFEDAERKFRFSFPCARCGEDVIISNSTAEIEEVREVLKRMGYTHEQCPKTAEEVVE